MNTKLFKHLCLLVLIAFLPTLTMAQKVVVRRTPSTSSSSARPSTSSPSKKSTSKKKTQSKKSASSSTSAVLMAAEEAARRFEEAAARLAAEEAAAASASTFQDFTITVNGVSFTMVAVQGGTFTMGATSEQGSDALDDEKPAHSVTLSDYYIGQTEVTQALWQAVMGSNPSNRKGNYLPVENVSWHDCDVFISKLNQLTGREFRLPTEAEWEYAARGGNESRSYKYAGSNDLGSVAWYDGNSGSQTHPVGQKQANELGIYDMSGNVWEWCQDWYDEDYYSKSPSTNPCNSGSGSFCVFRGGSWIYDARFCRVSNRTGPEVSNEFLGLRLAL